MISQPSLTINRRSFLYHAGGGFGALALANLLGSDLFAGPYKPRPGFSGGLHHKAKAQRVVQLFMNGGVSQMDTFDYKPALTKRHGEKVDFGIKAAATSTPGAIMKSPFAWKQYGQCGRWVSSVFPNLAQYVDDVAFLMAMASKTNVHGPASYMQNTGFILPGFPAMGSWISYALGSLSDNVPAFVVLPDPRGLPYNNAANFSAGFLPMSHQAVIIKPNAPVPIANLQPPRFAKGITQRSETEGLSLLKELNEAHRAQHPGDSRLESRIASYELAAKMQLSAPEALDISREPKPIQQLYGLDDKTTADFGHNCLVARRLVERGVRFVQVWSGTGGASKNWDNHTN